MNRRYMVSSANLPSGERSGGFAYGARDAARDYARDTLPGFDVIPGGRIESPGLWRFEAVNQSTQRGAVLWVREA